MGIADWFRRRDATSRPADLLAALLDGFDRGDYNAVKNLINEHGDAIREQFPSWTKVPERIRSDPAAVQRYANSLMAIARVFEKSGDRTLMDRLTGGGRAFAEWQDDLQRAQALIDGGRAAKAIPLLRATLESIRATRGSGVDYFAPRALGRLGIALAKIGNRTEAIAVTQEALEICRKAGDSEGVQAYTTSLKALGTYEVQFGDDPESAITVAFIDESGRTLAPDELLNASGTIRWEIHGGKPTNPEAKRLHQEGRDAGAREDYAAALSLFTRAADLDPAWPYPVYDRAFTYLLQHDFDRALSDYRKTLELSPRGFYTAAQAVDILTREAAAELPRGLYAAFALLEHVPQEDQRSILEQMVEQSPSCAPAWDAYVNFIDDDEARLAAIEKGLAARPDPDTRGSLLVKKALALSSLGHTSEAMEILRPLTASVGASLSAHAKAYVALAAISRPRT